MAAFDDIQKHLTLTKARKPSVDEAKNSNWPFDKYYTKTKARTIKRIPNIIYIPAFYYDANVGNPSPRNPICLLFQYNVAVGFDFYILGMEYQDPALGWTPLNIGYTFAFQDGLIAFKYREGANVSRYYYTGQNKHFTNVGQPAQDGLFFTAYKNQKIKGNFCLEFWLTTAVINIPSVRGIPNPLRIITSKLSIPQDENQMEVSIQANNPLTAAQIGVNLPEALPYNQDNQVWNTN